MKLILRITAALTAVAMSAAAFGCDKKKSSDDTSKTEASTASQTTTNDTADSKEDTVTTTASETEISSASTTTAASTAEAPATAAETTVQATESAPQKGFSSSFEAAKAYYTAYIKGDADAVYDMFCDEEIEGYHNYLSSTDLLDGKNPRVVFKRSNVVNAIKSSMAAIYGIMAGKSDVPHEQWAFSLTEDLLKPTGENELKDFNKTLGTNFPAASDCGHVYYKDGNEEHSFIGNACAFVQLNDRWYLSYTTVMNAELITYMDIF